MVSVKSVGGKTGSAEKPGVGGYQRSSLVSTFAAAFPMDHPRYVIVVSYDEPQGTVAASGQRTAASSAPGGGSRPRRAVNQKVEPAPRRLSTPTSPPRPCGAGWLKEATPVKVRAEC